MSASTQQALNRQPGSWRPGQSGNPGGRPKKIVDLAAMAREHGPECIAKCVALMRKSPDERVQFSALKELLDRGYGGPAQSVSSDGASSADLTLLHLLAARMLHDAAQPTLEAKVVADETTPPPDLYAPASE